MTHFLHVVLHMPCLPGLWGYCLNLFTMMEKTIIRDWR